MQQNSSEPFCLHGICLTAIVDETCKLSTAILLGTSNSRLALPFKCAGLRILNLTMDPVNLCALCVESKQCLDCAQETR